MTYRYIMVIDRSWLVCRYTDTTITFWQIQTNKSCWHHDHLLILVMVKRKSVMYHSHSNRRATRTRNHDTSKLTNNESSIDTVCFVFIIMVLRVPSQKHGIPISLLNALLHTLHACMHAWHAYIGTFIPNYITCYCTGVYITVHYMTVHYFFT